MNRGSRIRPEIFVELQWLLEFPTTVIRQGYFLLHNIIDAPLFSWFTRCMHEHGIPLWVGLFVLTLPACGDSSGSLCETTTDLCQGDRPIVEVSWLRNALEVDDDVQVIDVRTPTDFAAGHIPEALSLDVEALRAPDSASVAGQVASPDVIEAALRAAGLRDTARVVTLTNDVRPEPARVVWTLNYVGHANAHLLQGGWTAWVDAGGDVALGQPAPIMGDFNAGQMQNMLRVDASWVLDHLQDPTVTLVDARSADEYAAGHIPGALHINWQDDVVAGMLRDQSELSAHYAKVPHEGTVVTYCKSGMRASLTYVVLRSLGYADVRLYDGSWNEWGARDELPKEVP